MPGDQLVRWIGIPIAIYSGLRIALLLHVVVIERCMGGGRGKICDEILQRFGAVLRKRLSSLRRYT